jgi:hypothetical protein
MQSQKVSRYSEPVWWTTQHTIIWEEHLPALRTDFQQRNSAQRRSQLAHQGPDDAVFQKSANTPRNVDVDKATFVPDTNWEVGTVWEQIEPGVRYGVGARTQYPHYERWNDEVEARLRKEWSETNEPSTWEKVKRAVRHGFESARKNSS